MGTVSRYALRFAVLLFICDLLHSFKGLNLFGVGVHSSSVFRDNVEAGGVDNNDGDDGKDCNEGEEAGDSVETLREGVLGKTSSLGLRSGRLSAFTLLESNRGAGFIQPEDVDSVSASDEGGFEAGVVNEGNGRDEEAEASCASTSMVTSFSKKSANTTFMSFRPLLLFIFVTKDLETFRNSLSETLNPVSC